MVSWGPINILRSHGNIHMYMVNQKSLFCRKGCIFLTERCFSRSVLLSLNLGKTTHGSRSRLLDKRKMNSESSKHVFPFRAVTALNTELYT